VVYSANVGITSYFNSLNIASLISVVLYILDTVLLPMYAKLSDLIGRTEAFSIAIFFYVISGIVQAVAKNMDTLVVCTCFFFRIYVNMILTFFLGWASYLCSWFNRSWRFGTCSNCRYILNSSLTLEKLVLTFL
jgi:MFS family permease